MTRDQQIAKACGITLDDVRLARQYLRDKYGRGYMIDTYGLVQVKSQARRGHWMMYGGLWSGEIQVQVGIKK